MAAGQALTSAVRLYARQILWRRQLRLEKIRRELGTQTPVRLDKGW